MDCFASFAFPCGFFLVFSIICSLFCRWLQNVCCWVDIVIPNISCTSDMYLSAPCVLPLMLLNRAGFGSQQTFCFLDNALQQHCSSPHSFSYQLTNVMLWASHLSSFCQHFQLTIEHFLVVLNVPIYSFTNSFICFCRTPFRITVLMTVK